MKLHPVSSLTLGLAFACATAPASAADPILSVQPPYPTVGSVERLDPALDALLAPDAAMEKLASGFNWSEGPVWMGHEGWLVFSDVPENTVYRWRAGAGVDVFLKPSGYTAPKREGLMEGSNGLTLDHAGRLVLCQHGDRRVARLDADGKTFTTIVDRWDGKRFNSPNDLCFSRAGDLYFTDPSYGLDPKDEAEIGFQGVFRLARDGVVTVITCEMERPNGIALSPDERTLYVANSHDPRPVILAFALREDGSPGGEPRVFFDGSALMHQGRRGSFDGMKVDVAGNLWASGPGGILVISPAGKHLGTLLTGRATANCAFGDAGGDTLYLTADDLLLRVRTKTRGNGF